MAATIIVDGACLIKIDTGAANALETLGYSMEGVTIQEKGFYDDVPGDQNGGSAGPPIDIQHHGQIHTVQMDLSKIDDAIWRKMQARINLIKAAALSITASYGTPSPAGVLMSALGFRLCLISPTNPRNYLLAIPRGDMGSNKGTKYRRQSIVWECHALAGVMFNETVV